MLIDFDWTTVLFCTIIYILLCVFLYRVVKKQKIYFVFSGIMFVYFVTVIKYTLFPIPVLEALQTDSYYKIQYIPFVDGIQMTDVWNVIMTIPFGIGVPFIVDKVKDMRGVCIAGLLFGIIVESIQYMEMLLTKGSAMRVIDINDIICNFIGAVLGFLFLKIFAHLFVKIKEEQLNQFWKYVYKVCRRVCMGQ